MNAFFVSFIVFGGFVPFELNLSGLEGPISGTLSSNKPSP